IFLSRDDYFLAFLQRSRGALPQCIFIRRQVGRGPRSVWGGSHLFSIRCPRCGFNLCDAEAESREKCRASRQISEARFVEEAHIRKYEQRRRHRKQVQLFAVPSKRLRLALEVDVFAEHLDKAKRSEEH